MAETSRSGAERRQFPRLSFEIPATAVRRTSPLDSPGRVVSLHIVDVSRGGVGAMCSEELDELEPVVLFFPPMGARKGRDTHGLVVRCEERQTRYYIGIAFEEPWPERDHVAN